MKNIWDYAQELGRSNEGTTIKIDCIPIPHSQPQFERMYVCLDACKKGFKVGCRPFIGLDGFFKAYYGVNYCVLLDNMLTMEFFTLLHPNLGDKK